MNDNDIGRSRRGQQRFRGAAGKEAGPPVPVLERAAVGRPITRLGVSFFPVYLPGNDLPDISSGKEAGLVFDELPGPTVPSLLVSNPTDRPILAPEGEQLVGGLQDRVLNVSVLIAPSAKVEIPVSCLERGRWGGRRRFDRGRAFTPRRTRLAKNYSVAEAVSMQAGRRSDQGAVWASIDRELAQRQVRSATSAVREADQHLQRDRRLAEADQELARRGPLPGQCGLAVAHGRRMAAVDLFGSPELLKVHWSGLIRSYLAEQPAADGRPSAGRALHMVNRLGGPAEETPGIDLGVERHLTDRWMVGQVLTLDGAVVHASAFTTDAGGESRGRRRSAEAGRRPAEQPVF